MSQLSFQLTMVVRKLESGGHLAEVLTFPEVSCFHTSEQELPSRLDWLCRSLLEHDEPLNLHRRHACDPIEICEVPLTVDPPPRAIGWTNPLNLRFHAILWPHGRDPDGKPEEPGAPARPGAGEPTSPDSWIACVPELSIQVMARSRNELLERLPGHIRLALSTRGALGSLRDVVVCQQCSGVSVDSISVVAELQSPKQRAQEAERRRREKESVVKDVATDLTKEQLGPAFEVDHLVMRLAETLAGDAQRSVLLVGPSGAGKTAVFHELVRRRREFRLDFTPFWGTSGSRLVAGMSGFGMWQHRCQLLCEEAARGQAILHLGSLLELLEVGKSSGNAQGVASFLRPRISRGDFRAVVECTREEIPFIERQEPQFLKVLARLDVPEPDAETGKSILLEWAASGGPHGQASIEIEAIEQVDRLHRRFAGYSAYPGRPLRFLRNLLRDHAGKAPVLPGDVTAAFTRETGLPRFLLDDDVLVDLRAARDWFSRRVIGQSLAVDLAVDVLATAKAGLSRPHRPLASFLFIGPTGVGKTEMAKAISEFFFGDQGRMVRFDMSEYSDALSVARLTESSTPRYDACEGVGGEGQLTAKIREQPFTLLLFDEFEKAHPLFFDLLLQILGDARCTDSSGRTANFASAIIVMTSNLGANSLNQRSLGFADGAGQSGYARRRVRDTQEHFLEAVRAFLRPELFNRIDRIVPFVPLDEATALAITRRELDLVKARDGIRYRKLQIDLAEEAVSHLVRQGYDPRYGARPLKRTIEKQLLLPLADRLNQYAEHVPLDVSVRAGSDASALAVSVRGEDPKEISNRRVEKKREHSTPVALVEKCIALRRDVHALRRSEALRDIYNQLASLTNQQARLARRKHASPAARQRLARVPGLQALVAAVSEIESRAVELEDEVLGAFYEERLDAGRAEAFQERAQIVNRELEETLLLLYAEGFDKPHYVTLAIYSDRYWCLIQLVEAYAGIVRRRGGKLEVVHYTVAHDTRAKRRRLVRWSVPRVKGKRDPERPVDVYRDGWKKQNLAGGKKTLAARDPVGIALGVSMPGAYPWLAPETGQHVFRRDGNAVPCVVDTSGTPIRDYVPPEGAEMRLESWARSPAVARSYDLESTPASDDLAGHLEQALRARMLQAARVLLCHW